jgi:hypothetical protein
MTYAVRKANDSVLLTTLEKVITSLGAIGTNEANILSPDRVWVTFNNIPTSCGSNVGEGCRLLSILKLKVNQTFTPTNSTSHSR